jgi:hypothetical protein
MSAVPRIRRVAPAEAYALYPDGRTSATTYMHRQLP